MVYKIRRVHMDCYGDFKPRGKTTKYFATEERLALGGVYMLRGRDMRILCIALAGLCTIAAWAMIIYDGGRKK